MNFLLLITSVFLLWTCRQESLYLDEESSNASALRKNYVLNGSEIKKDVQLWTKLSEIQTRLFGANLMARNNDPLLDGAVIMTDYAGVMEKNGVSTYTFQVSRLYPTSTIENLVVRKNENGKYSGLLIQYLLSKQEIQNFQETQNPEIIKGKVRVYKINDIDIETSKGGYSYSEQVGCITVTYEVIPCTSSDQHTDPGQCSLSGAAAPQIVVVSIDDTHCVPSGNPGGTSPNAGSVLVPIPGSGTGGSSMTTPAEHLYNTFLFNNFGDAYNICGAGDSQCEANRQFNLQFQAYLMTLPPPSAMLTSYLYTFLTVKNYYKTNGGTDFLEERLFKLSQWYSNRSNANIHYVERDKFVSWGLEYLIQHPDVSWEQFENSFIKTPCEKTKSILQNPKVKTNIDSLEQTSKTTGEQAFLYQKDNTVSNLIHGDEHSVDLSAFTSYKGIYHNHTPLGVKMFSVSDIIKLYKTVMNQMTPLTMHDAFIAFVAYEKCNCPPDNYLYHNYILRFNGDMSQVGSIANLSAEEIQKLIGDYDKAYFTLRSTTQYRTGNDFSADLNAKGVEKLFFSTLENMNINPNTIILQKVEKDGTVNNVNLKVDGTTFYVKCP
ncbi:MAG: hypothetical protein LBE92_02405 [Chryseobacterium sp.]|uniref:hypothetical protein n=1 Tax=Chryseobacterium sp. TaxID=1871047 RepID=UPI002816C58C|nr:hypothetical protein [Chryseobacterium sp.]MDR2234952.1 hypothetical protein [Chryseobacterium sp.]